MATRRSAATQPSILSASSLHLANRFSFGADEQLISDMRSAHSSSKWFEKQLAPSKISDSRGAAVAGWFPHLKDSPSAAWAASKSQKRSAWQYGMDLSGYTIARKLVSRRQVQEVMADFWSNLLYIPAGEDRSFPWRFDYDQKIRAAALTSYRGLLRAAVVHPAMSGWLNNSSNTKAGINENLGRELLELFTVGRPAGYDENDVKNSARLLTGYRVKVFDGYAASYDPAMHWTGPIRVLGFTHANSSADGRPAVLAYLDYLARHPATAQRIAHRLCTRFVSDTPSASVVSAVASAYTRGDTDIKATLRAMVKHPDFVAARKSKLRSPLEDVIGAARVLGSRPTGAKTDAAFVTHVHWMSSTLGQDQFGWPRPDGFPETSTTWGSPARVLRSWDLHWALAGNWWGSKDLSRPKASAQLPSKWPRTLTELVEHQSRMLLGRTSTAPMRDAIAATLGTSTTRKYTQASDVSDWTWTVLRSGVLNHPEGMIR